MVTYTGDITNSNYAICYPYDMDGRQIIYGGTPYYNTYKSYVFANTNVTTGTWQNMATKGLVGKGNGSTYNIGQDFGSDSPKHIRKIRYQWMYNISKINIRASNAYNPFSSYVTILNNETVIQEDTSYNEIILPVSNSYRYWYINLRSFGPYGSYTAPCIGELEMMEAELRPYSNTFIL